MSNNKFKATDKGTLDNMMAVYASHASMFETKPLNFANNAKIGGFFAKPEAQFSAKSGFVKAMENSFKEHFAMDTKNARTLTAK